MSDILLGVVLQCHSAGRYYAKCYLLLSSIKLSVILLCFILPSVLYLLRSVLLTVLKCYSDIILLGVILPSIVPLSVVLLTAIQLSAIPLSVILLHVIYRGVVY